MKKFALIALATFTTTVFAVSGLTQPRRPPARGPRRPAVTAPAEPPMSERIAQELGAFRWGMTHEQVLEVFRTQFRNAYAPRMKNLGQVEQYRLIDERQREIRTLERSYVVFDGAQEHRQWDSSFIANEFTHNNNESMLVYQDERGNREFFLFINDRLWKRVQARNTNGARIQYDDFAAQLEALFGPGRRIQNGTRLDTVEWRDATTKLHTSDQTTFFSAFCLIYEETATLAQIATLRVNAPTKVVRRSAVNLDLPQATAGSVEGAPSTNVVDRITGKIRVVENADAGAAASASASAAGARNGNGGRNGADAGAGSIPGGGTPEDPLGLGGLGL